MLSLLCSACVVADDEPETEQLEQAATFGNACGNELVVPQIAGTAFIGPPALDASGVASVPWSPGRGRYGRAGIQYVAGPNLNLTITTDRCTFIAGVSLGSRAMTTINTGGYWYNAYASPMQPRDPLLASTDIYMNFLAQPQGATDTVTIRIGRVGTKLSASYSFPLVRVRTIDPARSDTPIGITSSELHNMFAEALSEKFGPTNSTIVTTEDGPRRIYDYDANALSVTVDDSVRFHLEFKADVDGCHPTLKVDGRFQLVANAGALGVVWPHAPIVNPQYGTACTILMDSLLGTVLSLIGDESGALDSVASAVMSQIDGIVATAVDAGDAYIVGASHTFDLVQVSIRTPVPSISITPAYDAFTATNVTGLQFAPGDRLALFATGFGVRQYVSTTPAHWVKAGPNGVPLTGVATFANAHTLARGSLVWSGQPVGRLLARTIGSWRPVFHDYVPGCAITVPSTPVVRFGANDTPGLVVEASAPVVRVMFLVTPAITVVRPDCLHTIDR